MAWTLVGSAAQWSGTDKVSSTTCVVNGVTNNINANDVAVIAIASDNVSTTDGDNGEISSVTDTKSNTWTKLVEFQNSRGAAANGAVAGVWYSKIATQLVAGTDTITVNFASNRIAKAAVVSRFTVTSGATITLEGSATNATNAGDPAAMTISGLASQEYLFFAAMAQEGLSTDNYTKDTNHTDDGSLGTTGGATLTNMTSRSAHRILTGTSSTHDAASTAGRDWGQIYVALKEAVAGGATLIKKAALRGLDRGTERGVRH